MRNKTRKASLPMHANTMKGLHHWYRREYEKMGWMVLAKAKGYDYKVSAYKKNIEHLLKSIKHVHDEYKDPDRKHDLNVLLMNTEVLVDFVNKNL